MAAKLQGETIESVKGLVELWQDKNNKDWDTYPTASELNNFRAELRRIPHSPLYKSYSGDITPSKDVIFVFGSNPEGRHGAGAAKVAKEKFGAIYGQGEGLQGSAYALPTKDLRVQENRGLRSISPSQITENIRKMYQVALNNPDKKFMVAYRNIGDKVSLNGYSGNEMIDMFLSAGEIPSNVYFSSEWVSTGKFNKGFNPIEMLDKALSPSFEAPEGKKVDTKFSTSGNNSYPSRTRENANWSDITIALAQDFNTAGEKLTKNAAKNKYVSSILSTESNNASEIAENLYNQIKAKGKVDNLKINIAGNGIYSMSQNQAYYNDLVTQILEELQNKGVTIAEIRSGGQTGIDEAGIIAHRG